jgi:hypothetical protein
MKTLENTTIRSLLQNTEFEYLADKFESAGNNNLQSFTLLINQGHFLNYLKNFENDEIKVLRLQKIIMDESVSLSKQFWNRYILIIIMIGIIFVIFFFLS